MVVLVVAVLEEDLGVFLGFGCWVLGAVGGRWGAWVAWLDGGRRCWLARKSRLRVSLSSTGRAESGLGNGGVEAGWLALFSFLRVSLRGRPAGAFPLWEVVGCLLGVWLGALWVWLYMILVSLAISSLLFSASCWALSFTPLQEAWSLARVPG